MPKFKRIKRPSLFAEVTEELERMIISGALHHGDKLPTEQALADQFGVGRSIIREVHKSLLERGLVAIRPGKGTFVTVPDETTISQALSRFVKTTDETYSTYLYDVRQALEVACIKLAIQRADDKDIRAIERAYEKLRGHVGSQRVSQATGLKLHLTADLEFHLSIARATHNPLFPALLKPIAALQIEISLKILRTQRLQDPSESVILHQEIAENIAKRNEKGAMQALLTVLQHSRELVERANKLS